MKCKKFKERTILKLYDELSQEEKAELESHIKECPDCAKDMEYSSQVFQLLEEAGTEPEPEANWEKTWKGIENTISEKPIKKRAFNPFPRWAYASAGILVVFALGILAGRFWLTSQKESIIPAATSAQYYQITLQKHLEELKPVLIEYANYASKNGGEALVMDKEVVRNLIIQNILLKRIMAGENPSTEQLLEDVDIVLREISNQKKEDTRTPTLIKYLISEREILFKMEILQKL